MTRSPLALLHPTAPPSAVLVLGHGCPAGLAPERLARGARADLVLVAPDRAELRRREWLVSAESEAERALADRGLVLVWGGPRVRRRARRLLRRGGLLPDTTVYLVPRRHVLAAPPTSLRLAACGLPGALVLRRPGGPPPLAWLGEPASAFSIRISPRTGTPVVDTFDGRWRKVVTAKITPAARDEHARLAALAPAARRAGAAVPDGRLIELPGVPALVQRSLRGRSAARVLMRSRRRPEDVIAQLTAWLIEWGKLTRKSREFERTTARRQLLDDLERVAPHFDARYTAWVRERCLALDEVEVPVVAAHGDLTMWNVLLDGRRFGVIDWESATEDGLPLVDFEYAVVDAIAASDSYRDRRAAFAGSTADWVAALRAGIVRALEVPEAVGELARHACWLHHAANEQRRPESGSRPFLEIARLHAAR